MEEKERLAARLDKLKDQWNNSSTPELVHLARELYEGLIELRYQESKPPALEQEAPAVPTKPQEDPPKPPSGRKIIVDLNDRWAFVNKLFGCNQDDFDRVIAQLNTMSTFTEARNFIEHVVKPDYHWDDQEEFETRFMELIERHFT